MNQLINYVYIHMKVLTRIDKTNGDRFTIYLAGHNGLGWQN